MLRNLDLETLKALVGRFRRDEGGMAMVEWAIAASMIFVSLMGAVVLGSVAHHKLQMANAVQAGIQYASVRKPIQQDTSGIIAAVERAAPADATATRQLTVTFYCECPGGAPVACDGLCSGASREAHVGLVMEEQHNLMLALPFLPETITLRSSGSVRLN